MFTKDTLEKSELPLNHVIYCDTDSAFLSIGPFVKDEIDDDKILKKIYVISEDLETYINKNVIQEFYKIHNLSAKSSVLSFKQEVIAKKALFLPGKKHYALDIIDRERTKLPENEYEIKGLEIRRSDASSESKIVLQTLLDMILREGKNVKEILDYVAEERKKVLELVIQGSKRIARPVSYTKSHYDKTIPGHIRGMFAWNELMKEDFRPGSRGLMFYVKGINAQTADKKLLQKYEEYFVAKNKKLTQIVIPDILEGLPDYFLPDEDRMLELAFDRRVLSLLEPLGVSSMIWAKKPTDILDW